MRCGKCKTCRGNTLDRCVTEVRDDLVANLAITRVAEIDTATLIELSLDEREDLDATIARMERRERKRLRKLSTEKLWAMSEDI